MGFSSSTYSTVGLGQSPELPSSVAQCHGVILELLGVLRERDGEMAQLEHRLEVLLKRVYGPRSERIDPNQLLMFAIQSMESSPEAKVGADACDDGVGPSSQPKKRGHGRRPLPRNLPRTRIEHTLNPEERRCACCGQSQERIGEQVSEQLEFIPASMRVIEHVRVKYACPHCKQDVSLAPKPPQPIDKGLAGPGLLAHICVSKYADHLPLNRLEGILGRQGVDIKRSTMSDWVLQLGRRLEPLLETVHRSIVQSTVIHSDDTPIRVQEPRGSPKGVRRGYIWVYLGDEDHPYNLFDYTRTRSRAGPERVLREFRGTKIEPRYLLADAYVGYDGIYQYNGILEVACWAHVRRYFVNARKSAPELAVPVLAFIKRLYQVEKQAKEQSPEQRRQLRLDKAAPILDELWQWLEPHVRGIDTKQPIGEALSYLNNLRPCLNRYLDDGRLPMDNNWCERSIRPVAIGRKNWLFAGSDRGARAGAHLATLISTAKRHMIDPFAYLRDIFTRIPTHPVDRMAQLLPPHWQPQA